MRAPAVVMMKSYAVAMVALICLTFFLSGASADDHTHTYKEKEEVTVWVNRVGPYHNPQETYDYFSLPFCQPKGKVIRHKENSLGVVLEGDELSDSGIHIKYLQNEEGKLCTMRLTPAQADKLSHAVAEHYWYQLYIDELPLWGMVGEHMSVPGEKEKSFVYTHKEFSIAYNGNRIIEVNLTSGNPRPIVPDQTFDLTYSVKWKPTTKSFASRFDRYLDFDFFEHKVHWFALFNSFMMVVFLCGVVALILLRTLRSDFLRYSRDDEDVDLEGAVEEAGWRQIHAQVMRPPQFMPLLSALVGVGAQLVALCFGCVIAVGVVGSMYDERGRLMMTVIFLYSTTSVIAGLVSGMYHKRYCDPKRASRWKHAMAITAIIIPGMCLVLQSVLNLVAFSYGSLAAVSATSMVYIFVIWLFVQCPLILIGTVIGRSLVRASEFKHPLNARPVPHGSPMSRGPILALLAGILPFGAIFIEVHFIFTSFWSYKFYYVYGFMFLIYLILLIVTLCVSVVATYFVLNAEDWRWAWTSFWCGASVGFYVFLYAIYYFFFKTHMSGLLQTAYFFGHVMLLCVSLSILAGAVGHIGARIFVSRIYQSKSD